MLRDSLGRNRCLAARAQGRPGGSGGYPARGRMNPEAPPAAILVEMRLEKLGFVFQFHFLLPEFSALDNVVLPMRRLARLDAAARRARGLQLLGDLGLEGHERKRPSQLSGGQRQRVAIARALANDPVIVLADEPTASLDTKSSENVRGILRDLASKQNRSVVAVTHDVHFASVADRVIEIVDGRIVTPASAGIAANQSATQPAS
ncbi:MAG: ABC transporter ATP-binding protein [Betaproteobacteria bacterium]|nr:ABC transporter ATP-binding protein [Betaproteobacteria bacterium]